MSSKKQRQLQHNPHNVIAAAHYSGPLPPAAQLIQYNQAHPDAAERIIKMAEQQAEHRRNIEQQVVIADGKRATLGLVFAAMIALLALGTSSLLIYTGHDSGAILFGATLVSIVSTFIYGTKTKRDRQGKP
jgi:uncharacterized membrane protein